ncbi:MAG: hypothetical protein K8I27_14705 [Planctomycetes bacterium]|nr:hypothetical protein [Planctomycetota bacterium]
MKPYVESGRTAQRLLWTASPERQRVLGNLRGLKQVINTFGVTAILLIPAVGAVTGDSAAACVVALHSLLVICVLEVVERRAKRKLTQLGTGRTSQRYSSDGR